MGAANETTKSGVGVAMMRPELINPKAKSYCLFDAYAHLSSGLTYGLIGVSMGKAIGIVGNAGVSAYTITHLSNKNIEKELKAKMPSLDEKHAMKPEKVGHELLLYNRFSSSPVEIPENVLLEPSKKGRCWNELKSRGMLKWGKRKKVQFLRNDETQKLLKKQ
ncbi:hypothetical protein Patl1_20225 [Pistacia atlantica]|uniref:Uncharacterized protein n=1 Tax=Pistacia atlantica TaxID=434234 RepID=A0ACC1BJP6_9ROSI|nr:hypothetical protein Patl1_20225 [Pistacia atlantica]